MNWNLIAIAGALTCCCTADANVSEEQPVLAKPPRLFIGMVMIMGNTVTHDCVIRETICLYPGQVLSYPELRLAERRLARLNLFEVNPTSAIRPTITVLDCDSDNEIKDILIQVKETCTLSAALKVRSHSKSRLDLCLVLEECNFDPEGWPTCMADIWEGRAFRGAGQKLRLQLCLPISTLP